MDTIIKDQARTIGNTAEYVAARLREAIVAGHIPANHPLKQDKIAAEFGVSKVPVREALVQLRSEGLVVFKPNRGAMVSELSAGEAHEIFLMRSVLEAEILKRAIPNLTKTDLIRAESVLRIIEQEESRGKWGQLNWEFHSMLYQAAGLPRMLGVIRGLHDNVGRYLIIYLSEQVFRQTSQTEHWKILKACGRGDVAEALTVLAGHLSSASEAVLVVLDQQEPGLEDRSPELIYG